MKSKRIHAVGGGYFLTLGGYGCVIDPGHHFLDNFFGKNHSIDDVNAIILTHFHNYHYGFVPYFKPYPNSNRCSFAELCSRSANKSPTSDLYLLFRQSKCSMPLFEYVC
jgi:glyoxylase-like metal-dependent hydrolase (beta-lactamase superfamily II)